MNAAAIASTRSDGMNSPQRGAQGRLAFHALMPVMALVLAAASASTLAQSTPQVSAAWVRGMVAGQGATGAFLVIDAAEPVSLVGARSPVAASAQVHEMAMEGTVMKMRPAPAVRIEPGHRLELKPGGYHIMLMGVRSPLKAGERVPLSLEFERADGGRIRVETQAEVRELNAAAPATAAPGSGHMHH